MLEAIVLAAGIGSRLKEVYKDAPKCLAPVAGRPILGWQLESLAKAGVDGVVIVTGYKADEVEAFARSVDAPFELRFVHNPDFATTNVLTSWRLGSEDLSHDHVYMHADTVFEPTLLTRLLSKSHADVVLTIDRRRCGEEEMKVAVRDYRIVSITKAMDAAYAFGEFTGVLRATAESLPKLRRLADELLVAPGSNRAFFEAALQLGLDRGTLEVDWVDVSDLRWQEIDFPADLAMANELMSKASERS